MFRIVDIFKFCMDAKSDLKKTKIFLSVVTKKILNKLKPIFTFISKANVVVLHNFLRSIRFVWQMKPASKTCKVRLYHDSQNDEVEK